MQARAEGPHARLTGPARSTYSLSDVWPALAVGAIAALWIFWRLGAGSLEDWDEAIYAQVSKEAVQGGNWMTLHWEYKPFFDKPPLFMWATAALFSVFGVSEFWARAASALAGVGLAVTTFLMAKAAYDKWVGFLAVAVLLTSYQFIASARFGTTDMMLALFSFLALYFYMRLARGGEKWWYAIFVSAALAVMVKSAMGLVAPAAIGVALLFDGRLKSSLRSKHFWGGALLAVAVAAPWHILMLAQHGQSFIDQYIGRSILSRSSNALEGHTGSRFYYVDRLGKYFFPWVYLAPFAIALSIRENLRGESRSRTLLIFAALLFGILTLAQTKLRWYLLPIYPALSILAAAMIAQSVRSHLSMAFSALAMATFIVALIAPTKIVLISALAGLPVLLYALATRGAAYRAAAVAMLIVLAGAGLNAIAPLYDKRESPVARLARIAESASPAGRKPLIVFSGLYQPAPLFYSGRPIEVAYTPEYLARFTEGDQVKEIVMAGKDVEALERDYEISLIAEDEPYVYGTIRRRSDK